jgi:hypothetical protein
MEMQMPATSTFGDYVVMSRQRGEGKENVRRSDTDDPLDHITVEHSGREKRREKRREEEKRVCGSARFFFSLRASLSLLSLLSLSSLSPPSLFLLSLSISSSSSSSSLSLSLFAFSCCHENTWKPYSFSHVFPSLSLPPLSLSPSLISQTDR